MSGDLLNETIALRATLILLLQLDELQLSEWLENVLEVILGDGEVDVADVEAVERNTVRLGGTTLAGLGDTILFCFSELGNDRNAE